MKLDDNILTIDGKTFITEHKSHFHYLIAEYKELYDFKIQVKDFLTELTITVKSPDGFGTHLFHELEFYKNDDNSIQIVFVCNQPNKYWEGNYGLSTLLMELIEQVKNSEDLEVTEDSFEFESEWKYLNVYADVYDDFVLSEIVDKYSKIIINLIKQAESSLSGAIWKKEYEKKESSFSTEIFIIA
jgi:hypothetical protein